MGSGPGMEKKQLFELALETTVGDVHNNDSEGEEGIVGFGMAATPYFATRIRGSWDCM